MVHYNTRVVRIFESDSGFLDERCLGYIFCFLFSQERHNDPSAKTSNFMATRPNVTPFATPMMPLDSDEGISYDGEVLYFTKPLCIPNSFGNIFFSFSSLQRYLLSILFQVAGFWPSFLINGEIFTAYDVFIMRVKGVNYVR